TELATCDDEPEHGGENHGPARESGDRRLTRCRRERSYCIRSRGLASNGRFDDSEQAGERGDGENETVSDADGAHFHEFYTHEERHRGALAFFVWLVSLRKMSSRSVDSVSLPKIGIEHLAARLPICSGLEPLTSSRSGATARTWAPSSSRARRRS